ncbi:MAG: glycosyltransferase [Nitrospinota bacterium]
MIAFCLPAYNEGENIRSLLRKIEERCFEGAWQVRVYLVDDGSTDDTAEAVSSFEGRLPITLLRNGINLGLGRALRRGILRALDELGDEDILITMDADNTHDPVHCIGMVEALQAGSDVVIASRFQEGAREIGLSLFRRLLSRCARIVLSSFFRTENVRDYTCGFRAYRAGLLKRAQRAYGDAFMTAPGFSVMSEILLKLRPLNPTIAEVPLTLNYNLKRGRSKLAIMKTIIEYFATLSRVYRQARKVGLEGAHQERR